MSKWFTLLQKRPQYTTYMMIAFLWGPSFTFSHSHGPHICDPNHSLCLLKLIFLNIHWFEYFLEKHQPIDLIFYTFMGPQFIVWTIQYSCIKGKYPSVYFTSYFFMDFEKFVKNIQKNSKKSKIVGCTRLS